MCLYKYSSRNDNCLERDGSLSVLADVADVLMYK